MVAPQQSQRTNFGQLVYRCEQALNGDYADGPCGRAVDEKELEMCCRVVLDAIGRRKRLVSLDPERHVRPALRAVLGDPSFPGMVRYCALDIWRRYHALSGEVAVDDVDLGDRADIVRWTRPFVAVGILLAVVLPRRCGEVSPAYVARGVRWRFVDPGVRKAMRRAARRGAMDQLDEYPESRFALSAEVKELAEELASGLVAVAEASLAEVRPSQPARRLRALLGCVGLVLRRADPALESIAEVTDAVITGLHVRSDEASRLRRLVEAEAEPNELANLTRRPMWSDFRQLLEHRLCGGLHRILHPAPNKE